VKRAATLASLATCGAAGVLVALLFAATPLAGADGGTTGETPTTESPPATTPEPTPPTPAPGPRLIVAGTTVAGTLVGGLTKAEATEVVRAAFARPLKLVVSPSRTLTVAPRDLGAAAHVGAAVGRALSFRTPGLNVPLAVDVPTARLQRYAKQLGKTLDRAPVDSHWAMHAFRPIPTAAVAGRRLNRLLTERAIAHAFRAHEREPLTLPLRDLEPKVTPDSIGHAIVIKRGDNRLFLYQGKRFVRRFQVATGQSTYPTPIGHFEVVVKQRNPWWYPPAGSAWAKGEEPVPPGPGNPLGTRWMGLSAPYVGIHGTPDAASIGYSASHGCIRMRIPEAEWLFDHVEVGTQVFIVAA